MIGTPVEDAQLRLKCWELAITMAGGQRCDVDTVDKMATAAYSFIATGADSNESKPAAKARDKSK